MQNWPSNFHIFSFQSSNFQFCQFSPLTFNFCQFKAPLLLLLLLSLNPLNDVVLHVCFIFYFFNSELKEKSGKKRKKKTLRGMMSSFPFPNSFHSLFEALSSSLVQLFFLSKPNSSSTNQISNTNQTSNPN